MAASVLIVDDHESFRSAVRRLLVADGFAVVGEAGTGNAALVAVRDLRPDVVLLDIALPDIDGFAVADTLSTQDEPPVVVLVSSRSRADYGGQVAVSPVRGFIAKSELSGAALRSMLLPRTA